MNEGLRKKLIEACAEIGIRFKVVDVDGEWHRTDVSNDPHGTDDASIKLFKEGNGDIVKNWKSGETRVVFSGPTHDSFNKSHAGTKNNCVSAGSTASLSCGLTEIATEVARRAKRIWDVAGQASPDHPYLLKKKVGTHGIRQYKGLLIIPVIVDTEIKSLQFITTEGKKKFLKKGTVKDGYFLINGEKECTM